MTLLVAAAGWVVGLLLAAYGVGAIPQAAAAFGALAGAAVIARRNRSAASGLLALLFIGSAALGEWRYRAYESVQRASLVAQYVGRSTVDVHGVVADEPIAYGSGWEFPVAARQVELAGDWTAASGTVMVQGVATAPYRVGDVLDVAGVLAAPDAQSPSYLSPLRQAGIVATTSRPTIVPLGVREASALTWLANRREDAAAALNRSLPEPEAGLARGITLGERRTLSPELTSDFQRTNTSHILAVDGLKVGYAAALFSTALGLLRAPAVTALGTVLGLALYTAFVGASPSAVRAAVMGGLYALGRALGRPADSLTWLALAIVGMTADNPYLLWAPALQLSAITTAGMVLLVPIVEDWFPEWLLPRHHSGPRGALREALVTTAAAEVASAPLVATTYSQLSLVSLPVHFVVMPLLPFGIGLSALTAAAGLAAPRLGSVVGLLAWVPLAAIVGTVQLAAALSFAALPLPPLGVGWVVAAYLALGLALLSRANPFFGPGLPAACRWSRVTTVVAPRVLVPALVLPLALGTAYVVANRPPVDRLTFLDESGDAALIELADGNRLYLQGNGNVAQTARVLGPALPFWDRRVDLAILTAANDNALTDLGDLSGRLPLRQVIIPESGFSEVALGHWRQTAQTNQLTVIPGPSGTVARLGKASAKIVALPGAPKQGRAAAIEPSLAVIVTVGSTRMLWVSARPADQATLAASGLVPPAPILKLVGQASAWGLDPAFFQAANPEVVILPSGAASRFAKPAPGTLALLADRQVFRTDLDGTVTIEVNGGRLVVTRGR